MKFRGETEGKNTLSLAPHIYTQRCVKQIGPWIKQYMVFTENHSSAKVNHYNNSKYHLLNAYFVPDTANYSLWTISFSPYNIHARQVLSSDFIRKQSFREVILWFDFLRQTLLKNILFCHIITLHLKNGVLKLLQSARVMSVQAETSRVTGQPAECVPRIQKKIPGGRGEAFILKSQMAVGMVREMVYQILLASFSNLELDVSQLCITVKSAPVA